MSRRIVLDSNLLLLLVVGSASRDFVGTHRRLRSYDIFDFDLLIELLSPPIHIVLTPNTVTEVSNLVDRAGTADAAIRINQSLRALLLRWDEIYVPSRDVFETKAVDRLGVTDAALLFLLQPGTSLLTTDLPLYVAAIKAGCEATNFNHYREANWYR